MSPSATPRASSSPSRRRRASSARSPTPRATRADLYAPGVGARLGAVAQSAVALARPSDYWIDVIAAGRRVRLADAQRAAGQRADDEGARVGAVVAALMRCADVAAACADVVVVD